jgi:mono/diheme cytochrome c family protein
MRALGAVAVSVVTIIGAAFAALAAAPVDAPPDGRALYNSTCASCHGLDGKGRTPEQTGFDLELPDFSDCVFASREANGDWFSIIHEGGPRRSFSRMMPAFGSALSTEQIEAILGHIRTFCTDRRWPRGEFNLPAAMFTEKAFPEDEAVWRTFVTAEGATAIESLLTYEKRFGARGQLELNLPFALLESTDRGTQFGIGDIEVAWKQNVIANLDSGTIVTIAGAATLPTGNARHGFGGGTYILEPQLLLGQILPEDAFFQAQLLAEFPLKSGLPNELGWRAVVGKTWAAEEGFGRAFTPMIEVLGARPLESGAVTEWDVVPQLQVSLSQRQHILFNAGARIPLNETQRATQFVFYVIWDWYDGGLFEAWH